MKITIAEGKGGELISSILGKIHTGPGSYLEDRQRPPTVSDPGEGSYQEQATTVGMHF